MRLKMNSLVAAFLMAILVVLAVEAQQKCGRRRCTEDQCCIRNRFCRPLTTEGGVCGMEGRELPVCPCSAGLECTGDNVRRCTSSETTQGAMTTTPELSTDIGGK
ncbi:U33-theraphotoxin-Cg1c-like [Uloborus diversus]|uniref:U33-theraphotoxin-Cg1c-like n=1 Tax=Uloborus diversus TaxID=327109 RepID=UPI00240A9B57|nr:U33-theraphotoxin-Cg1c-like [Uloborus diversus]